MRILNQYKPIVGKPARITYGYDKRNRSWCAIVEDENGYEIESSYDGAKVGIDSEIERLKEKHGIKDVIKLRPY